MVPLKGTRSSSRTQDLPIKRNESTPLKSGKTGIYHRNQNARKRTNSCLQLSKGNGRTSKAEKKRIVREANNPNREERDKICTIENKAKHLREERDCHLPSDDDLSSSEMDPSPSTTGSSDGEERAERSMMQAAIDDGNESELLPNVPQSLSSRRMEIGGRRREHRANNTTNSNDNDDRRGEANSALQNQLKVDLNEAIRDKRAYAAAFLTLKDQKSLLEREITQLKQDNLALQASLDTTRVGRKGRKPVWSQENLKGTNIDSFQGICLAAGGLAKKEAAYITTETYWDETEQIRRRNWVGSTCFTTLEVANETKLNVLLPNGILSIPMFCMKRCLEGEDYSSGIKSPKQFASHCLQKVLQGPVGSLMSDSEKRECISKIIAHKETVQKFRGILSDTVGNRKKASFQIYIRTLGYKQAAKSNSKHLTSDERSSRLSERELLHSRVVLTDENGETNTMTWRLLEHSRLSKRKSSGAIEVECDSSADQEEGFIDHLFLNNAAKRAFICLRGYSLPSTQKEYLRDVSIVCLARADAYMTTMLKWIKVGGKGGVRNCDIRDSFRTIFPIAMRNIIKDVWEDIKTMAPEEMYAEIGNSKESPDDPFGNNLREWTMVMMHPSDECLYLVAKPRYFSKMVCSWFGTVKDCHIGRCGRQDTVFTRIDTSLGLEEIEESDMEEEVEGTEKIIAADAENDNVSQDI